MAKKAIISTETLNAIGQAIIEKGGATSPMYPKDMPTAIKSIQGSGEGRIPPGGTKGQVLSKKSNTDFDLEWKMGGDMRHEEFDALKRVDDLNPENTGITQICSLLNQIKNLLKPSCIAIFVSLLSISAYSAYVETNKLVNLIGKSNVVTGVSFDGLLTGINTNGHPVTVTGGVADIVFPEGGGSSGITTNAVRDIVATMPIVRTNETGIIQAAKITTVQVIDVPGLCFTASAPNSTITMEQTGTEPKISLDYTTDGTTWNTFISSADSIIRTVTLTNVGDRVWIRATDVGNEKFAVNWANYWRFVMSGSLSASGSIEYLRNKNGFISVSGIGRTYASLFENCTALTSAPELPAMTLGANCYNSMFEGCTSLTAAPALPATNLAAQCYYAMFWKCTSLTNAPSLPATTLKTSCYSYMFEECKSLISLPALQATELSNECYYAMFRGCTAIKLSKTKTSEYTTPYRIPSVDNAISVGHNSLLKMFLDTGGTFTGTPTTNVTYYGAWDESPYVTSNTVNRMIAAIPQGGVTPSVVTGIVESAAVTNAGAVASSKAYADGTFLELTGGTVTGDIDIDGGDINIEGKHFLCFEYGEKWFDISYWTNNNGYAQFRLGRNDGEFFRFAKSKSTALKDHFHSDLYPDNTDVATHGSISNAFPIVTNAYTKGEVNTALAQKADLAAPSAANNFAALTSSGNLADSGKKASDFVQLLEDTNNKKTAVTIGSRISSDIPEWSSTNSYLQGLSVWKNEGGDKKYYMCVARNPTVAGTFNTSEWKSYLIGPYSFVVGTNCWSGIHDYGMSEYCHSEGLQTYSEGIACHVEGERSIASGYYTHAEGIMTYAAGTSAHAEGIKGDATNHVTFVWNGNYAVKPGTQIIDRDATVRYGSHGNGTFNVNPKGGADGFWIGDSSLSTLVNSKIQSITNKVYATDKGDMTGKAGYNVKWAMIGSSRTIIVDHASEKINKIQFSGAWGGSRGYSAKLLAWVNNGQDPSDSSTTVCALSDNVATEVNKNLPIVFEFSTGIALPEGSRLIVSACDPSKTWNDVKNVTWSQIATTYPSGHGMRWLCGTVQDTGCRTCEENKTEIIQKRCPDAIFTSYGTCASKDDLKLLSGKSFGLSTQQEMAIAISNIIEKLGGSVTSMP